MIFIIGQAFFMFKGIQNAPFFLYHMFSTRHAAQSSYRILVVKTEKGIFNYKTLSNREYELIVGSAEFYAALHKSGDPAEKIVEKRFGGIDTTMFIWANRLLVNDTVAITSYPLWWARYFSEITGHRYQSAMLFYTDIVYSSSLVKNTPSDTLFIVKLPR